MRFRLITLNRLAEMICGNKPLVEFPYRTSSQLTSFFYDLDIDHAHDGSTRSAWVETVLLELNTGEPDAGAMPPNDLTRVIEYLLHPDHFLDARWGTGLDRESAVIGVNELLRSYRLQIAIAGTTGLPKLLEAGTGVSQPVQGEGSAILASLPPPPPDYDLVGLVDYLKAGLLAGLAGGQMPDESYVRIRKLLLGNPATGGAVPEFLRSSRNPLEARDSILSAFESPAARKTHVRDTMNKLAEELEGDSGGELINYENLGLVGEGGFGQVYRFRHRLLGVDFAVKVFAPAFKQWDGGNLDRFFREARVLLRLNHPYIPRFFETGMFGRRPYIRTEFFEGMTLGDYFQEHGLMPPAKALVLALHMATALAHAHEAGVVHRDLKPGNVMVAPGELVRVIDFGLGVVIEDDLVSRITKTGQQAVASVYTAPELLADPRLIDPVTDVYSLGAVWFAAMVGRAPAGTGVSRRLKEVPGLSEESRSVLIRCLDDSAQRYSSGVEVAAAIHALGAT